MRPTISPTPRPPTIDVGKHPRARDAADGWWMSGQRADAPLGGWVVVGSARLVAQRGDRRTVLSLRHGAGTHPVATTTDTQGIHD